ncbi:pilus assembly protein [Qipengyuania sp. GH38]|uniref:TadE/TadG family type IV pilus assembly protein n=1 Tax=Qipengyuania intermedia TaxID=2867244 RepID=UPI001C86B4FD|nr:TadE/TadG family type IV pilus assembly protein [Qipengyuania intermedia]MBX7515267.1 pilus assembly protein [Qipengyuania intermedia]
MIATFAKLVRSTRGNATIEVALVMPLVLAMALGGIDFAMGYRHKVEMQQTAQLGAEYVMGTLENVPPDPVVEAVVSDASGLPMGNIKVQTRIECDGVKQTIGAPFCVNPTAVETKFMTITVNEDWEPMLNIKGIADYATKQNHVGSVTIRTQ